MIGIFVKNEGCTVDCILGTQLERRLMKQSEYKFICLDDVFIFVKLNLGVLMWGVDCFVIFILKSEYFNVG